MAVRYIAKGDTVFATRYKDRILVYDSVSNTLDLYGSVSSEDDAAEYIKSAYPPCRRKYVYIIVGDVKRYTPEGSC